MPKMQVTEAEKLLILQEQHRLELDNRDWSREPFVADRDLVCMSPYMKDRFRLSNIWIYDYLALGYRNIDHEVNSTWYIEYLMGKVSSGEAAPADLPGLLSKLPAYGKNNAD